MSNNKQSSVEWLFERKNNMKPDIKITKKPCKKHKSPELPYLAWHAYPEKRYKKGDRQNRCKVCGRWYFKDEL